MLAADKTLKDNLFDGLQVNTKIAATRLFQSPAITTALSPYIGYNKASELAKEMKTSGSDIFAANQKLKLMNEDELKKVLLPQNLLKLGYSIKDLE